MIGRVAAILSMVFLTSCDRGAVSTGPARATARPAVASLVPAATDILVGMGAGDHVVAVSNYDTERAEIAGLPKVGDYQSVDWERLTTIRPDVLITFQAPDRLPAGMRQRAEALGVRLVNIRTETVEDICHEITHLGDVANEPAKAAATLERFRSELEGVRAAVGSRPRVRTLILRDERGTGAVGTGNFLHDILEVAGGTNVVRSAGWPNLDREQVLSLDPDAILLLLSGVPEHVEASARRAMASMPNLRAVREGRVTIINVWYSQVPGLQLPELARRFAGALHAGVGQVGEPRMDRDAR